MTSRPETDETFEPAVKAARAAYDEAYEAGLHSDVESCAPWFGWHAALKAAAPLLPGQGVILPEIPDSSTAPDEEEAHRLNAARMMIAAASSMIRTAPKPLGDLPQVVAEAMVGAAARSLHGQFLGTDYRTCERAAIDALQVALPHLVAGPQYVARAEGARLRAAVEQAVRDLAAAGLTPKPALVDKALGDLRRALEV